MATRKTRESNGFHLPDATWKKSFRRRLLCWYRRAARDLPWRRERDPYQIWISEVMLQQTQVATVRPYFHRFLREFPNIRTLAEADERRVLRLWEGLGYYRRARQLHEAARAMVEQHDAQFPRDPQTVRSLPGIGRYTAGAILSIAFDARLPVLEANTVRLLSRLLAYDQNPMRAAGQRLLWTFAEQLLPRQNVGTLNQALMELGSEICTPQTPKCGECPVALQCITRAHGLQTAIPVRGKPVRYEDVQEVAVVMHRRGRILLRECPASERWAGLWDFPRFAVPPDSIKRLEMGVVHKIKELTGLTVSTGKRLTKIKHGVTRFRITLHCYEVSVRSGRRHRSLGKTRWVSPSELEDYPLSVTGRRISRLLLSKPNDGTAKTSSRGS